jgi:hypothetical protein
VQSPRRISRIRLVDPKSKKQTRPFNQKPTSKAIAEEANALERKKKDQSNNSSKPRTWQSRSRLGKIRITKKGKLEKGKQNM